MSEYGLQTVGENEVCRRYPYLKQSVYLTVGSMMNALCTPNEDVLAMEFKVENSERTFCPRELKKRYVQVCLFSFFKYI